MSVSSTSQLAYTQIKPQLGKRQTQVYLALKELGSATNEMLAEYLGVPINYITGRTFELKKFDMVDVVGLGKNKSGFSAKVWAVKDMNDKKLIEMARDCEA